MRRSSAAGRAARLRKVRVADGSAALWEQTGGQAGQRLPTKSSGRCGWLEGIHIRSSWPPIAPSLQADMQAELRDIERRWRGTRRPAQNELRRQVDERRARAAARQQLARQALPEPRVTSADWRRRWRGRRSGMITAGIASGARGAAAGAAGDPQRLHGALSPAALAHMAARISCDLASSNLIAGCHRLGGVRRKRTTRRAGHSAAAAGARSMSSSSATGTGFRMMSSTGQWALTAFRSISSCSSLAVNSSRTVPVTF